MGADVDEPVAHRREVRKRLRDVEQQHKGLEIFNETAVCAACHGADGNAAIPSYPNLAGQNKAYLISSLKAYKNKKRNGGMAAIMQGQAAALSDQDIENLAEYYSSMK